MIRTTNNANSIFDNSLNFPDFSTEGYEIDYILGRNFSGGRVTYKGRILETHESVVIKQFQFATVGACWSGFTALERELYLLQQLNHPRIPKCIEYFETPTGFCLVQEYIDACCLSDWISSPQPPIKREDFEEIGNKRLSLSKLASIEKIAVGILEILVYLQQQVPSVIHRDIKPENILVDEELNVYLVDFGLAQISAEDMGASTMVKGTLGFMSPEQIFGKPLTNASDLYSVGATLICLLTQTPSQQIGNLIDDSVQFNIHQLLPELNIHWVDWLERMVAPNQAHRFPDAATALHSLLKINTVDSTDISKLQHNYPLVFAMSLMTFCLGFISAQSLRSLEAKPLPVFVPAEELPIRPIPRPRLKRRLSRVYTCVDCYLRYTVLREEDLRNLNFEATNPPAGALYGKRYYSSP
ncbi:MAG: serine/threonine protein kinase [Calothrix sp. C42_A2020_038]|nr:serine/threonine protein kinase [Calothrix sp. C42_A2020_038]